MSRVQYTKGYSLVEVLVAVAILMLAIVGPMTIASKSFQSALYSKHQNTAFFLAQEGISIVNVMRNDAGLGFLLDPGVNPDPWLWVSTATLVPCFLSTGCNIDFTDATLTNNVTNCAIDPNDCQLLFSASAARAMYQSSSGDLSPFTRKIYLTQVSSDEVQVNVVVSWESTIDTSEDQQVSLTTSLFNIYK